uniref:Putative zinc-or iron-chelating protein n=1 Tax=viral metagenome TaxID=1070528 RepID=A0A6M3L0B1_9ZZZZ
MSVPEFCKDWLIREWWVADGDDIIVPAPRRDFNRYRGKFSLKETRIMFQVDLNGSGFVAATWGHNFIRDFPCVFLTPDERCLIHESKPQECRILHSRSRTKEPREKIATYWRKHQDWIDEVVKQIE